MFTEERQNAIEKCLREKGKVRVKELSEMFKEDLRRSDPVTGVSSGEKRSRQAYVQS